MTEDRSWRDAKIPNWVSESIERDLHSAKLTAALSWPTEARPAPMPFFWGPYDRLVGEPIPGHYWTIDRGPKAIQIAKQTGSIGEKWKSWIFKSSSEKWTTGVTRGHLFECEHDARLEMLWRECAKSARLLKSIRDQLYHWRTADMICTMCGEPTSNPCSETTSAVPSVGCAGHGLVDRHYTMKSVKIIAGKTLDQWRDFAQRDDCLDRMVPSDLRQLISAIT